MVVRVWVFILALLVSACGPVHKNVSLDKNGAESIRFLAVEMESKGDFEVIMERATATAGPAVMFGLIGAAVASAHNNSLDIEKEKRISKYIDNIDHQTSVSNGLYEGLKVQNNFSVVDATSPENNAADSVLELTIQDWGLKVVDKRHGASSLTPFVQIKCVVRHKSDNKKMMDLQETYFGDNSHSFDKYESDGQMLIDELQSVLHKAGRQVGTRMAYTLGGSRS